MAAPDPDFIAHRTILLTLTDGTRVRVRPITPDDKWRLQEGLQRMSPESRYRRFMSPVNELTSQQLRYLTEIDYHDHFAWAALLEDTPDEPGVGVARYIRDRDDPEVAEAAVAVLDDFQGRGIGTLLLQALSAVALENGIRRFRTYALADNTAVAKLLKGFGAHVTRDAAGTVCAEIDITERAEALEGTSLYAVLRAVARGEVDLVEPFALRGPPSAS